MKLPRVLALLSLLTGCAAIIGVPDLSFDPESTQGNPDGSTGLNDGSSPTDDGGSPTNDGSLSGECKADLQTDPKHCGRCDHGCGGGTCTAGKCDAVMLVDDFLGTDQLALDGAFLYFPIYTPAVVRRVKKDATGAAETLLSNVENAMGVAVEGTTLYFAGYNGVEKCNLGADIATCVSSRKAISSAGFARTLAVSNGDVLVAQNGNITRVLPNDAGDVLVSDSSPQPYSLAIGGGYIYWTSNANVLSRIQLDGGNEETAGPQAARSNANIPYVTAEGDGFFWAYKDRFSDAGFVYGGKHADLATRKAYTQAAIHPIGIAADPQYVYWSDRGNLNGLVAAGDGQLLACPRAGCGAAPIVLATGLRGAGPIALDDKFIYFAENNNFEGPGRIRKVAKP